MSPGEGLTASREQESVAALSLATRESAAVATPPEGSLTGRVKAVLWSTPRPRLVVGWTVFAVAFVVYTVFLGLPYSEDDILLWLTVALFVASLSDLGAWRRGLIRDWLPLYVVLAVYALLRGYASDVLWGPFFRPQVAFDSFIGGGQPPTVTLQRWLFRANDLRPWDYLAWLTYMSHFFTSFIVAAVLWKCDRARFQRFIALFVSLTFLGYLT